MSSGVPDPLESGCQEQDFRLRETYGSFLRFGVR